AKFRRLLQIDSDQMVFIAGSTQDPEESFAIDCYQQLVDRFSQLRLLLVPRHPERFQEVAKLLDESGIEWTRRSQIADPDNPADRTRTETVQPVVLVDSIGELSSIWGLADIAFVGGSMGKRGGQNMIEPAAFGAAVSFGPKTSNFRGVVRLLLDHDAATVVRDAESMRSFVRECCENPAQSTAMGQRARETVLTQQGAVGKTINTLLPLLDDQRSRNTVNHRQDPSVEDDLNNDQRAA
ncbi:MAG: 3-deoxy-D-manno-octulosonic acid transferase, partial [Planctomycetota bacterium]